VRPAVHGALVVALALLLAIFSCGPGAAPPPPASAWERTEEAVIYLIALHDGGVGGTRIGCGDSLVPVEVELSAPAPALRAALEALLSIDTPYDPRSGYYTALHSSPLEIRRLERVGDGVRIDLAGWVELEDDCDAPRVLEQLTSTATRFRDVARVEIYVDGAPLARALGARGGLGPGTG
jgi:hypothetical protein